MGERLKQSDHNAGTQALLNDSQQERKINEEYKWKKQEEKYNREAEQ